MSHTHPLTNPLIPAKPAVISLDTLPQLFAHHKARFGGWTMTAGTPEPDPPAPPARPEGISEEEWSALGDPGKAALVREREARQEVERKLAAAHARPGPPKPDVRTGIKPPKPAQPADTTPPAAPAAPATPKAGEEPDIASIVQQAVAAAIKPFEEREAERANQDAAAKVQTAVREAAEKVLQSAGDALALIDLTSVIDEHGAADPAKITAALDNLVRDKPYLAKTGGTNGIGVRSATPATGDPEKVKAILAEMQRATGVRAPKESHA